MSRIQKYDTGNVLEAAVVTAEGLPSTLKGGAVQQNTLKLVNPNLNASTTSYSKLQLAGAKLKNFTGKANSILGSEKGQGFMGVASSALDIAKGFVKTQEEKGKNPTGYETQQAIGDTLTKVPIPIVQAAGLAYKGISMLAEATGGNTNSITKEQAADIGVSKGERLLNNIVGALHPGAG